MGFVLIFSFFDWLLSFSFYWVVAVSELDFQVSSERKSYNLFFSIFSSGYFSFWICCFLLISVWFFFAHLLSESSHSVLAFWAEGHESRRPNHCKCFFLVFFGGFVVFCLEIYSFIRSNIRCYFELMYAYTLALVPKPCQYVWRMPFVSVK